MTNERLTEREQRILEHLERARSLEVSLKEYAEAFALDVTDLYNGKAQLVRKGILPGREPSEAPADFLPVRVTAPPCASGNCRILHPDGWILEFATVPEPAWLRALLGAGHAS